MVAQFETGDKCDPSTFSVTISTRKMRMTLLIMDDEIVALQGVGTILIKAGVKVISFIEKNIYTEKNEKG